MSRRNQPTKSAKAEAPSIVHRVASTISDWRVLLGAAFALMLFGGAAYGVKDKIATKKELGDSTKGISAVLDDQQKHLTSHDIEFARFGQKLDDIAQTVHEIREEQLLRRR